MVEPENSAELLSDRRGRRWRTVIGIVLMVIGIAMASLAGLCGLVFINYDAGSAFAFSGPVIAIGAAIAWGGNGLRRSARAGLTAAERDKVIERFD